MVSLCVCVTVIAFVFILGLGALLNCHVLCIVHYFVIILVLIVVIEGYGQVNKILTGGEISTSLGLKPIYG